MTSPITTALTDRLTALRNKPVAHVYGRHLVAGNLILRDDQPDDVTVLFVGLGEGEWDAVEELRLNGLAIADGPGFHFHPGKAGEAGTGGVSGDQKIDLWFPATLNQTNFSNLAYVAIRSANDIEAPTNEFLVQGKYKTRKVKTFDAAGVELSFGYATNPVWQVLDTLLLTEPASRIDFASFAAEAAYADETVTVDGVNYPRFESHVALHQSQVDLGAALQALLNTCRGFLFDDGGKIFIRLDQPRNAAHTFNKSNISDGSFRFWQRDIRSATNRLRLKFRDLENDFAVTSLPFNRQWAQDLLGKVNESELDLGNSYQQQAKRIGEYWLTRAVDDRRMVALGGLQDSIHLLPGDRVDVSHELAPWDGLKAFEVIEVSDDGGEQRELLLQEYDVAAFTDDADALAQLGGGVIVTSLRPPPQPVFAIAAAGDGFLEFGAIGFAALDVSTKFIQAATFVVFHVDETAAAATTLTNAVDAAETAWLVADATGIVQDDLLNIEGEIVKVTSVNGTTVNVTRAEKASTAAAHDAGVPLNTVRRTTFVYSFAFNFFGSE